MLIYDSSVAEYRLVSITACACQLIILKKVHNSSAGKYKPICVPVCA